MLSLTLVEHPARFRICTLATWVYPRKTKADFLEEVNTELSMLYLLIEVFEGDDDFGEEFRTTGLIFSLIKLANVTLAYSDYRSSLPIYLFSLISARREKIAEGYPVKKVTLWAFFYFQKRRLMLQIP